MTTAQREQWRALIATTYSALHQQQPGSLVTLEEYLYRRSADMIGSLSQLIRGAPILAIADGSDQIAWDLPEAVPVDYAAVRGASARPRRPWPLRPSRKR